MARILELLLTETVDHLGIVGDVVKVRAGYARNFLLPRGIGMPPSEEAIAELSARRAEAETEMLRRTEMRSEMVEKLAGHEIHIERSCNDQGLLYGSVTQKDVAEALDADGFEVHARDVRLPHAIKRLDTYDVLIKFNTDLSTTIKVWVIPDRELDTDEREEMEFDNEGNLIEKSVKKSKPESTESSSDTAPVIQGQPVDS